MGVLIKNSVLERIVAGEVDTLFRRQRRPTVKAGGTLRTRMGMLDIVEVDRIGLGDVTDDDSRRAGFASADDARAALTEKPEGVFYRVRVRPGGLDPRDALRTDDQLSAADLAELVARLDRIDARSGHGPWTRAVLRVIAARPRERAPDLAASFGRETKPFKADVRKLKALGLTISHEVGYELSPRGRALLDHLDH